MRMNRSLLLSLVVLVVMLPLATFAVSAQPVAFTPYMQSVSPGGQYTGPGDIVPPNGPPGASVCWDVQPAACNVYGVTGMDAGCPDPAIAVEHQVYMYWDEPPGWSSWDCIDHPEGQYKGKVTRAELASICTTARATLSGPPLVDFVVFGPGYDVPSLYVHPHKALREYCVTHLSHMGPDVSECNPNYTQAFTKPHLTQWPNTGQPGKTIPHFAIEVTRLGYTTYYGFWDNPGTGELADYVTLNKHCAEDANGAAPNIDGARIRINCDCQEGALALIDAANPSNPFPSNLEVYWFFAEP